MSDASTWASLFRALAPGSWQEAGQRFYGAIGTMFDAGDSLVRAALRVRSIRQSIADPSSLRQHGKDRGIDRLPIDTDASYASRLLNAFVAYGLGSADLQTRLREAGYTSAIVYAERDWLTGLGWPLFWVVIRDPSLLTLTFALDDGTLLDGTKKLGTVSAADMASIQSIIRKWKAAHERCQAVILVASGYILDGTWALDTGVTLATSGATAQFSV